MQEWKIHSNGARGGIKWLQPFLNISLAMCGKTLNIIIDFGSVISVPWILCRDIILNRERPLCINGKEKTGTTLKAQNSELVREVAMEYYSLVVKWQNPESERPGILLRVVLQSHFTLVSLSFHFCKNEGDTSVYPREVLEKEINTWKVNIKWNNAWQSASHDACHVVSGGLLP